MIVSGCPVLTKYICLLERPGRLDLIFVGLMSHQDTALVNGCMFASALAGGYSPGLWLRGMPSYAACRVHERTLGAEGL